MRRILDRVFNQPSSIDCISVNQGWTSPGGHPLEVLRRGAPREGPMGAFVRDSLDPGIVMQVDSSADVDRRWAYLLAGRPDFVKLNLLMSEAHGRAAPAVTAMCNRGRQVRDDWHMRQGDY